MTVLETKTKQQRHLFTSANMPINIPARFVTLLRAYSLMLLVIYLKNNSLIYPCICTKLVEKTLEHSGALSVSDVGCS